MTSPRGFSAILIVIVVAVLGAGAYWFLTAREAGPEPQGPETGAFVDIPELGVRLFMPVAMSDIVYETHSSAPGTAEAYLSSRSLIAAEAAEGGSGYCLPEHFPLGYVTRENGTLEYRGPQATCLDDAAYQTSYLEPLRPAVDTAVLREEVPGAAWAEYANAEHGYRVSYPAAYGEPTTGVRSPSVTNIMYFTRTWPTEDGSGGLASITIATDLLGGPEDCYLELCTLPSSMSVEAAGVTWRHVWTERETAYLAEREGKRYFIVFENEPGAQAVLQSFAFTD